MNHTIYTASPSSLKIKVREVLRYLNVKEPDEALLSLVYDCIEQCRRVIMPKAVYVKCPVSIDGKTVDLGELRMDSQKLSAFLDGANEAYVFVATLGAMADREVNKYLRAEPSRGVIINAVMIAFVEEFCDKLNGYLLGVDASTKRFSPGYGDLALAHQKEVLKLLNAEKNVGITLTDTCLMVPTKSVSAIVGIK